MRLIAEILLMLAAGVCAAGHLGYLYPGGGRAGETIEILAGGQGNWGCRSIHVDGGSGIRCVKVDMAANIPFLYPSQREYAKKAIRCLRENKPIPPLPEKRDDWRKCPWLEQLDTLSEVQMDLLLRGVYTRPNPLQMSPSINQKIILTLEIAPDAAPGVRYLRLTGTGWVSNPVPFFIGGAPEIREPGFTPPYEKRPEPEIAPPAALNGQIMPGETDRFRVRLKRDTRYYFKLFGRFFKPYIGDGVPGFFQPVIELCDGAGRQIAIADRDGLEADPLMVCTVPADGVYTLKIRDALYRGRRDFVYRVECGTGDYPRPAHPAELPGLPKKQWLPGMAAETPVVVTGELAPGEQRTVRIPGRKGEVKVFQTFARATGSLIDPVLRLFGPDGKLCAENDDAEPEVLLGKQMHFADAFLMVTLPADGEYLLEIAESAGQPGRFALRIDRPRPDFELILAPSGVEAAMAGIVSAELFIRRREGFAAPIALSLENAGKLQLCGNVVVPPGANRMPVTFRAIPFPLNARPEPFRLIGTAKTPDGSTLVRAAVAADPTMQAFAYTHYVPAPTPIWTARWRTPYTIPSALPVPFLVAGRPGQAVHYRLEMNRLPNEAAFGKPEADNVPAWLELGEVRLLSHPARPRNGVLDLTFRFRPDAPPGALHALLVRVPLQYSVKNKENQSRTVRSTVTLPALRIEVERTRP